MSELMHDPAFYYAIAFFSFVVLAYFLGRKPALGWLDGEIAKIGAELDAARQLRSEAEASLEDCKTKQVKAERDAKVIVEMARREVEEMRAKAETDLAAHLAHQQHMASERIRMAESDAVAMVRATAINMSMSLARKMLAEDASKTDAAGLVEAAISDIASLKLAKEG